MRLGQCCLELHCGTVLFLSSIKRFRRKLAQNSSFKTIPSWTHRVIGHLHDDVILLLQPESFKVLLSCVNKGFCFVNLARITKFKYERSLFDTSQLKFQA